MISIICLMASSRDIQNSLLESSHYKISHSHNNLLRDLRKGHARSTFVILRFFERRDIRTGLQCLAHGIPHSAGPLAVDDSHEQQACREGAFEIALQIFESLLHKLATQVQFKSRRFRSTQGCSPT